MKPPDTDAPLESTSVRDPLVGRTVSQFEIVRRIGQGGMGIVYEGLQKQIGRRVAVKIMRPDFSSGKKQQLLLEEARLAASIRHRSIVEIYDFGSLPDVGSYIVMEYLDGKRFDEVIAERGKLEVTDCIDIALEVLAALSAAHKQGVVHQDLKPSNLFLMGKAGEQYIKVMDFGLARQVANYDAQSAPTVLDMMQGTPDYMSPEQAKIQAVTPQTDLYALGCVIFEMLTGRIPFKGPSPMLTAMMHVTEAPPRAIALRPDVPLALSNLIDRLLEKEPAKRPGSADAVRVELKQLKRELGEPVVEPVPVAATSGVKRTSSPLLAPLPTDSISAVGIPRADASMEPTEQQRSIPRKSTGSPRVSARAQAVAGPKEAQGPKVSSRQAAVPPAPAPAPTQMDVPAQAAAAPAEAPKRTGRLVAIIIGVGVLAAIAIAAALLR